MVMKPFGYIVALLAVLGVTVMLVPLRPTVNPTSVALALLLPVLFTAIAFGSGPALTGAVAGTLCLNYFFLPPIGTFTIQDPQNWVALAVFGLTAVTVGQLSARVRRRAEEAESSQREVARLYQELQDAFDRASEAEALRRSERLKSALLDAVTHDLRTPLTSIKASATTLLRADSVSDDAEERLALPADQRRELAQVIDEETDRLNRFIESLVELAHIDAGALDVDRRWRSLDEIIASALARAAAQTKQHQIEVDLEPELPIVRVDARALSEVVYTLVDNAAKYAPAGSTIRITGRRSVPDMVDIMVDDEGPGIPEDLREQVFTKFFRIDRDAHTVSGAGAAGSAGVGVGARAGAGAAATVGAKGLGMGLAIARGITEAHDGRIWIEDGPHGRGTRIICRIPIGDDDPADA
jgi:K+-sensing histidine kinase KdpD